MCDSKVNPWVSVHSAAGKVAAGVRSLGTKRAEKAWWLRDGGGGRFTN